MLRYNLPGSIRCVLFDFDGTLTAPNGLDFAEIRKRMGCPAGESILEYIESAVDAETRSYANRVLEEAEAEAARMAVLRDGAADYVKAVRKRGVRTGIITRNSKPSIDRSFENFAELRVADFDLIITRDEDLRAKPHPDGVLYAARKFGIDSDRIALVGDFRYDMESARAAGALAVFFAGTSADEPPPQSDIVVRSYDELRQRLDPVLQLPVGKVPNRLLSGYFSRFGNGLSTDDSSILVGPGIGEDSAIVDVGDGPLIAVKSDPITFVSDDAVHGALLVNANDIATCGARPRWYMCTLLFPEGTAECEVDEAFRELFAAAAEMGIALCGGHSEITDAVKRLVVSGTLLGQVSRDQLVRKRGMREGDVIVLTKAAALEGSAILAAGFEAELGCAGLSVAELAEAATYRNEMSIVADARIAGVESTAMHDVTEGGIATALAELAAAGGHILRVDLERIPLRAATSRICEALGVDPLGLIGSGALLITCAAAAVPGLARRLADSGISSEVIGEVGSAVAPGGSPTVEARRGGERVSMPSFDVDELARLFALRQERRATLALSTSLSPPPPRSVNPEVPPRRYTKR